MSKFTTETVNTPAEADIKFSMAKGMRTMELFDGGDHIRVVIRSLNEPHEWYYLEQQEVLTLLAYAATWVRDRD